MKTRNSWIFVLAAFFCGALFCTQALAKVCFVGDEECGSGASFEPAEELPNKDLCRQEKYDTLAKEYEARFGPLTLNGANSDAWLQDPWPWDAGFDTDE